MNLTQTKGKQTLGHDRQQQGTLGRTHTDTGLK